jgi:hypothetical protein
VLGVLGVLDVEVEAAVEEKLHAHAESESWIWLAGRLAGRQAVPAHNSTGR